MTTPTTGQVWRNPHGAHVVVGDPGVVDGHPVLWVTPCTPDGAPTGGAPIPMNPPTPGGAGFPGSTWTAVAS